MNRARFLKTLAALAVAPSIAKQIDWTPPAVAAKAETAFNYTQVISATALSASSMTVTDGRYFLVGDMIRDGATGEVMRVRAVHNDFDGLTVERPFLPFGSQDARPAALKTIPKNSPERNFLAARSGVRSPDDKPKKAVRQSQSSAKHSTVRTNLPAHRSERNR